MTIQDYQLSVQIDWRNLAKIPKDQQSEGLCIQAVNMDWRALEFVKISNSSLNFRAVGTDGAALQFVPKDKQTEELCLLAIMTGTFEDENPLQYAHIKTFYVCKAAVEKYDDSLRYITAPSPELCMIAVKTFYKAINYIESPSKSLLKAAVSNSYLALGCKALLQNQTEELCLLGLHQSHKAAIYFKSGYSRDFYMKAITFNPASFAYFPKNIVDYEMVLEAVKLDWRTILFAPNNMLTEELCLAAYDQNPATLRFLMNEFYIEKDFAFTDAEFRMERILDAQVLQSIITMNTERELSVQLESHRSNSTSAIITSTNRRNDIL